MRKQFACMTNEVMHGKPVFLRIKEEIRSREQMDRCVARIPHIAAYESVYSFERWEKGMPDPRSAVIDKIYLDFDDAEDPQKALLDAAKVANGIGHTTQWFSGKKGVGMLIHIEPAHLIDEMKSTVLRHFVVEMSERFGGLETLDFSVIGDLNRVHRIIDTRHQSTRLFAIGLHARELSQRSIEEIKAAAAKKRALTQVPRPSRSVAEQLLRIEESMLLDRMMRMRHERQIGRRTIDTLRGVMQTGNRQPVHDFMRDVEDEYARIRRMHTKEPDGIVGKSPEETWLLQVVDIFKQTQRAANIRPPRSSVSTSSSEHEARCHIVKLARECGYVDNQIIEMFRGADGFNPKITKWMITSLR